MGSCSPSPSYFQKTVTLVDWWLTKPKPKPKPQSDHHSQTLGVAGLTSQQNRPARCFSSAPILKIFDLFELETVDGVSVILQGFINKPRTLSNGFPPQVFDHFIIGFPPNWKDYCPRVESASKFITRVQEEDGKDSFEGPGKPQKSDGYPMDMGVQDCKDKIFDDKSSIPLTSSSVEIPHEHIIEAGNEVVCERSLVTPKFKDDPSLEMSPIVSNTYQSPTRSKGLGVSSRRMTRSMKNLDNCKNSFPLASDMSNLDKGILIDPGILGSSRNLKEIAVNVVNCVVKSKSRIIDPKSSGGCGKGSNKTVSCSQDTVIKMESKRKLFDHNSDVITKDKGNKDDADVSGESQINMRVSDIEDIHITPKCSNVNDDTVIVKTNTKGYRNKNRNKVDIPQKGVPATRRTSSKEAVMNRNRSKTQLLVKRKLISSPKSAKSTSLRGNKGSEERKPVNQKPLSSPKSAKSTSLRGKKGSEELNGSANILSIDSFSAKRSRSGRVVLPPLAFWRNQKVVYDEDREMCGVQEPK